MTAASVPQLFIRSDYRHAHQALIESGFWSPLMWMTRSSSSLPAGYYYSLVGRKFWIIGSSTSDCHIVFHDALISSQHAMLLAAPNRQIYFSDLQSVNGSLINDTHAVSPTLLVQGDILQIGPYEIEFQNSGDLSMGQQSPHQKLVLLVQDSDFQSKIWRDILCTFGISVHYERCMKQDLPDRMDGLLKTLDELPDLLIADVENLKPNAYEFCRWCRDHYPDLKIILTCSDRNELFEAEKRWAVNQGAVNFLPGFPEKSPWTNLPEVVARVDCVLQAISSRVLQQGSLEPILRSLMNKSSYSSESSRKPPFPE
jgi:CheY-like chemotaxis protein